MSTLHPDFLNGFACGQAAYGEEVSERSTLTDADITVWLKEQFSQQVATRDRAAACFFGEQPTSDAYRAGFVTGYLYYAFMAPEAPTFIDVLCPEVLPNRAMMVCSGNELSQR